MTRAVTRAVAARRTKRKVEPPKRRPRVASVATVRKGSVSLPESHWEWLGGQARVEGLSLSYYLSLLVEAHMEASEQQIGVEES